jgi:hypothetical protein
VTKQEIEKRARAICSEVKSRQSVTGTGKIQGGDYLELAIYVLAEHIAVIEERLERMHRASGENP